MSAEIALAKSEPGGTSQAIVGAVIPPVRIVNASSSKATPSHCAPASIAVRATGNKP
ncbi:unannotated protein [freshwater metagenome]|uniref:Unannotated protein n=1 Tax=freshwater metagenome TaxID=449393 RepID=A0A6J6W7N5_9ZZZZ